MWHTRRYTGVCLISEVPLEHQLSEQYQRRKPEEESLQEPNRRGVPVAGPLRESIGVHPFRHMNRVRQVADHLDDRHMPEQ